MRRYSGYATRTPSRSGGICPAGREAKSRARERGFGSWHSLDQSVDVGGALGLTSTPAMVDGSTGRECIVCNAWSTAALRSGLASDVNSPAKPSPRLTSSESAVRSLSR